MKRGLPTWEAPALRLAVFYLMKFVILWGSWTGIP